MKLSDDNFEFQTNYLWPIKIFCLEDLKVIIYMLGPKVYQGNYYKKFFETVIKTFSKKISYVPFEDLKSKKLKREALDIIIQYW